MIFSTILLAGAAVAGPMDLAWLKGTTDKSPLEYKIGEDIVFTITAEGVVGEVPKGRFQLEYTRTGDDGLRETGKIPFDAKTPWQYRTRSLTNGFVRLEVYLLNEHGKQFRKPFVGDTTTPEGRKAMNEYEKSPHEVFFDGGAAVEPDDLKSAAEPADFDAFWARQFARLKRVPLTARRAPAVNPVKGDDYRMEAFEVSCAGLRPVTGFIIMPPDASPAKRYPARLQVFGYNRMHPMHRPPRGRYWNDNIVVEINAHGYPLKELGYCEADRQQFLWAVGSPIIGAGKYDYAFNPKQNENPETAYFNGMLLRVKRALQYIKTLPEWNGKDLEVSGGSQGGLQSIWAAGCGEGVTHASVSIPWCCDMIMNDLRGSGKIAGISWMIGWQPALGYYDVVNWAKRIPGNCRVDITRAGLGDYVCPPMGVYKLWLAIPNNKSITWVQGSQHGYVPPPYAGRDFTLQK